MQLRAAERPASSQSNRSLDWAAVDKQATRTKRPGLTRREIALPGCAGGVGAVGCWKVPADAGVVLALEGREGRVR